MIKKEKLINQFLAVNYSLTGQDIVIADINDVSVKMSFLEVDEVDVRFDDSNGYIGSMVMSGSELGEFVYFGENALEPEAGDEIKEEPELKEEERKLLVNMIETPDGTLLQSKIQNDFVSHKDKNGSVYFIDGGLSYRRIMGENWIDRALYEGDSHEELREHFKWGSRGVNGGEPLKWITLKDMTNEHINAIIIEGHGADYVRELMKDEMQWRAFAGKYL